MSGFDLPVASLKSAWIIERARLAAEALEALGEMEDIPPAVPAPPRRVARGRNRTATGRTAPVPKAPVVRRWREGGRFAPVPAAERGEDGKAREVAKPAPAPRVEIPREVERRKSAHALVMLGALTAVVLDEAPVWQVGDVVPVSRYTRAGERDAPLVVEILTLEHVRWCDLTNDMIRRLGWEPGPYAAQRYPRARGTRAEATAARYRTARQRMEADETPVCFATFTPSTVEDPGAILDDEHGRAMAWVENPRWLAPTGKAGDGHGYTENDVRGLRDAGVCVPESYQRQRQREAVPSIKAGLVKGVKKSEEKRVVGRKVAHDRYRQNDPTHGIHREPRRKARKATLERRDEATVDEIKAFASEHLEFEVAPFQERALRRFVAGTNGDLLEAA